MKKLLIIFATIFSINLAFSTKVLGAENHVFDQAGIFSASEITSLNDKLNTFINEANFDFAIVTIDSNDYDSTYEYAKNFYLNHKMGTRNDRSGGLFIIDLDYRDYYLLTNNQFEYYLTQTRVDNILDSVNSQIRAGNYYEASMSVVSDVHSAFNDGVPSDEYSYNEATGQYEPIHHYNWLVLIISGGLGILLSVTFFLITSNNYRLKKVQYQYAYSSKSKLSLTHNQDRLVNSFITTRRIPKNTSHNNHGGGGGGNTFGGGGRSF